MPGPTTEILSEDVKILRDDFHKVEISLKDDIRKAEISSKDDIRKAEISLKDDIHRVENSLKESILKVEGSLTESILRVEGSLREGIHKVDLRVTKLATEFAVARWVVAATLVATLSGIGSGIWWAATITAEVKHLSSGMDERFKAADVRADEKLKALEARTDERFKAVDARFDRLEASIANIAKLIEQTRPTPRP